VNKRHPGTIGSELETKCVHQEQLVTGGPERSGQASCHEESSFPPALARPQRLNVHSLPLAAKTPLESLLTFPRCSC